MTTASNNARLHDASPLTAGEIEDKDKDTSI